MKKRLRKKKHHGEFTEWGRQIVITRNRKDGIDDFLDTFVEEAIEANGCYCGGGGGDEKLDFVVELGRSSADPDAKRLSRNKLYSFLSRYAHAEVSKHERGVHPSIPQGERFTVRFVKVIS
jgi:uncharacterized protein YggL (DUF469 family)